jgi:hypothetical protein
MGTLILGVSNPYLLAVNLESTGKKGRTWQARIRNYGMYYLLPRC